MAKDRSKLTVDRVRLIRSMKKILRDIINYDNYDSVVLNICKDTGYYNKTVDLAKQFKKVVSAIYLDADEQYLSLSQKEKFRVSYSRSKKTTLDESKRTMTTLGKYLMRVYVVKMQEFEPYMQTMWLIDNFINYFTTAVLADVYALDELLSMSVKEFSGDELVNQYRTTSIKSCMAGEASSLLGLYKINPDKVRYLSFFDGQMRALLWNCDDNSKVLDRLYPSGHFKRPLIEKWAKHKGYVTRDSAIIDRHQPAYSVSSGIRLTNDVKKLVTLKFKDGGNKVTFPYMDTFKFGKFDREAGTITLTNAMSQKEGFNVLLESTSGGYVERHCCSICSRAVDRVYTDPTNETIKYCDKCYNDRFFTCESCRKISRTEGRKQVYDDYNGRTVNYCAECAKNFGSCKLCKKSFMPNKNSDEEFPMLTIIDETIVLLDRKDVCEQCVSRSYICEMCGSYMDAEVIDKQEDMCKFKISGETRCNKLNIILVEGEDKCSGCKHNTNIAKAVGNCANGCCTTYICNICYSTIYTKCPHCKKPASKETNSYMKKAEKVIVDNKEEYYHSRCVKEAKLEASGYLWSDELNAFVKP